MVDKQGPVVKAFLDNEHFRDGGITGQNPVLPVNLEDESGINTTGYGIGHDLVATLNTMPVKYYILNNFFKAERNSFRRGAPGVSPWQALRRGRIPCTSGHGLPTIAPAMPCCFLLL